MTTRTEQKQHTRQKIVGATEALLQSKTPDQLLISDITREAGVAHGTFYVHFQSKEQLLQELVEDFNAVVRESLFGIWQQAGDDDLRGLVSAMADSFLSHIESNRYLLTSLGDKYGDQLPVAWIAHGVNPPMVEAVAQAIDARFGDDNGTEFDPELLTHAVLAVWARLGFRFALDRQSNKNKISFMLQELTLAALTRFLPGLGDNKE